MEIIFAEIEYEPRPNSAKQLIPSIPAQAISQRAIDPIREKLYAMRRLASDNPLTWKMPGFFYKQAKFMKDFTDDYPENIQFSMSYPCYQHMGYEQLRTYFTWRTKARNGEYPPTSSSYIFIYIYELLCGIGLSNPAAGPDMLLEVWLACREQAPALDKYLPGWLKDYHIYYALPGFSDFVSKHGLHRHYPELFLFEADAGYSLELWSDISNYKIAKSKFYCGDNVQLLKDCFCAVLNGIKSFCAGRNFRIDDLFIYETDIRVGGLSGHETGTRTGGLSEHKAGKRVAWQPFRQALFYDWLRQPDRRVEMLTETYHLQNGLWTVDVSMHHSGRAVLAGYIIKKTEACLRQAVKYKFKLTAGHEEVNRSYQKFKALGITLTDLDHVITDAVAHFQRERTRTVVSVSRDNLTRIREEALGTQVKLTVQDESIAAIPVVTAVEPSGIAASRRGGRPCPPGLGDESNLRADRSVRPYETLTQFPLQKLSALSELQTIPDGWSAFNDMLTPTERMALQLLLNEDTSTHTSIKALADENGIMLEVLADSINEKATDHIGDNILEMNETMTIYDEYKEKIRSRIHS